MFYKLLFRRKNYAKHSIRRQGKLPPTAFRVDATDLAHRPLAYRLARMTAIRMGWPVTVCGRLGEVTNGRFVEFQFAETGFG